MAVIVVVVVVVTAAAALRLLDALLELGLSLRDLLLAGGAHVADLDLKAHLLTRQGVVRVDPEAVGEDVDDPERDRLSVRPLGDELVAKGGRTWPAWTVLIALVTATFAMGRTAEHWLPYVPSLGVSRDGSNHETPPVVPVAGGPQKESGDAGNATAKAAAGTAKSARSSGCK